MKIRENIIEGILVKAIELRYNENPKDICEDCPNFSENLDNEACDKCELLDEDILEKRLTECALFDSVADLIKYSQLRISIWGHEEVKNKFSFLIYDRGGIASYSNEDFNPNFYKHTVYYDPTNSEISIKECVTDVCNSIQNVWNSIAQKYYTGLKHTIELIAEYAIKYILNKREKYIFLRDILYSRITDLLNIYNKDMYYINNAGETEYFEIEDFINQWEILESLMEIKFYELSENKFSFLPQDALDINTCHNCDMMNIVITKFQDGKSPFDWNYY